MDLSLYDTRNGYSDLGGGYGAFEGAGIFGHIASQRRNALFHTLTYIHMYLRKCPQRATRISGSILSGENALFDLIS